MMKLKVNFTLPTKDFKHYENVVLPVTCHLDPEAVQQGDFEYSVIMPEFMFKELADSEPQFSTVNESNNKINGLFSEKSVTRKFKRNQTSKTIRMLIDYMYDLTSFLNKKYSIETATKKKKIFIQFNHSQSQTTNGLNGGYWGEQITQSFRYFTGYEIMTENYGRLFESGVKKKYITAIFYASPMSSLKHRDTNFQEQEGLSLPLPAHNQRTEDFERNFSIIDWTEEREQFCEKIKQTFINVNTELSSFLKDLDNNKFDELTSGNVLKMLK